MIKSGCCKCPDWKNGKDGLDAFLTLGHDYGLSYEGPIWSFCPWCGQLLPKRIQMNRFCTQCGKALKFEKTEISEYDTESGEPTEWRVYKCPSKGFFSPEHDALWVTEDENGKLIEWIF